MSEELLFNVCCGEAGVQTAFIIEKSSMNEWQEQQGELSGFMLNSVAQSCII